MLSHVPHSGGRSTAYFTLAQASSETPSDLSCDDRSVAGSLREVMTSPPVWVTLTSLSLTLTAVTLPLLINAATCDNGTSSAGGVLPRSAEKMIAPMAITMIKYTKLFLGRAVFT